MSPYPWLLQLLQKQLLEVILLVLMADQSQSLTWVMAMLSTLLSSAALPWWQKERVPACQRKGSAESRRVTVFLTFLSVWQTAASFIDMATHTWAQWQADNERSYTFSCFCWAFSVSPYLLFSVNLRIVPFFSSATSHTSVDQIQIHSRLQPKLHIFKTTLPYLQRLVQPYTSITLLPTLWPLLAQLSSEYQNDGVTSVLQSWTTVTLCVFWTENFYLKKLFTYRSGLPPVCLCWYLMLLDLIHTCLIYSFLCHAVVESN